MVFLLLLSLMLAQGCGDQADDIAALRAQATRGASEAQSNLGGMYDAGQDVVQDYEAAGKWLRLAADQGQAGAQHSLGVMYDNGQGVVQDYEAAVEWYRLAADQGQASAQNNLGVMYDNGRGVVQDYVQAHKWYNLAAAHLTGYDRSQAVKRRAAVEAKIRPAQVAEAQKMAREWRQKTQ